MATASRFLWGLRLSLRRLREPDSMVLLLEQHGVPELWRRSIGEALDVIEVIARIVLLDTIPASVICSIEAA